MATLISHSIYNQLAVVLRAASIQACSISARSGSSEATWAENEAFWGSNSERKMVWQCLTLVERVCESPSFRLPPCLQWTCLYYLLIYCKCPLRMYIQVFTIWRCVRTHCNLQGAAFTLSTARGRIKIWMADVVSWRKSWRLGLREATHVVRMLWRNLVNRARRLAMRWCCFVLRFSDTDWVAHFRGFLMYSILLYNDIVQIY